MRLRRPCSTLTLGVNKRKETFVHFGFKELALGLKEHGMNYSTFMGAVAKQGIELNRKVLADLAMNHPEAFKAIIDKVKK